jgi:hypothetical protein
MAQYMFLIYGDEAAFGDEPPSPEAWAQMLAAHQAFQAGVVAGGGAVLSGEALAPTTTATTVRPGAGEDPLVTDGPFAETKEALGGFYLVEAADLDQALSFAASVPTTGCVEVRPVIPTNGQ